MPQQMLAAGCDVVTSGDKLLGGPQASLIVGSRKMASTSASRPRLATCGRDPAPALPDNLCFMMVNGEPREAIAVLFDYAPNGEGGLYEDMFG